MGFIDSYKHLEKLCGETLNNERRISAYIDEMLNTPRGSYFVRGWDEDLKQLKHYRWVRNQIVHEPGCFEANMCHPDDAVWLDNFYSRIMNQTDPLALYAKATTPRATATTPQAKPACQAKSIQNDKPEPTEHNHPQQSNNHTDRIVIFFLLLLLTIIIGVIIMLLQSFYSGGAL